jgi:hypothetical protein
MRVLLVIGVVVVPAMHGHPQGWRELQRERAEHGEGMLEPQRHGEAPVRYQPMKPEIDAEHAESEHPERQQGDPRSS